MDKISIIVPVYKVEKYLDRCINSIINQQYKNLEIILVDDGSPDNCPKMCDEWAKKDARIKVIHKTNGGVSDARNQGLKMATGKWVAFIDSDDTIEQCFSEFIEFAIKSNATLCYSDSFGYKYFSYCRVIMNLTDNQIADFLDHNFAVPCWAKIVKREFIERNALYFLDGPNAEDEEWVIRMLTKLDSIAFYNKKVYNYDATENSASRAIKYANFESIFRNHKIMFKNIDASGFNKKAKRKMKAHLVNMLYYLISTSGKYIGDLDQYIELVINNKNLLVKPSRFKIKLIYVCVKLLGIKNAMKFFKRLRK